MGPGPKEVRTPYTYERTQSREFEVAFEDVVYVECQREFNLGAERTFHFEFEAEFDVDFDFGFDMECRSQAFENLLLDRENSSEGRIWMSRRPPRGEFRCPGELFLLRK